MRSHLMIFAALILAILACAAFNNFEEQLPSQAFFLGTVFGAITPSVLAVAAFEVISRWRRRIDVPSCVAAYLVCTTGLVAYAFYALNGKADSLHSAAHMHVIMFPMLHGALAIVALSLAGLLTAGHWAFRTYVSPKVA
jgi:hypothetical protein